MLKSVKIPRFVIKIIILILGVVLMTFASFFFSKPWLTPVLGAIPIYPIFLQQVNRRLYKEALSWVFFWAVVQSVVIIVACFLAPAVAAKAIATGEVYTKEMFHWIRTGIGAEGSLNLFLPIHLKHYVLFCFLSFLTLGGAALILGTYLLNYMNFYVARLINLSVNPILATFVAWPPWSILRVMGYIISGIALTALSLSFIAKFKKQSEHPFPFNYWLIGIGFIVADIIVKTFLAPFWRQLLLLALDG